MPEPRVALLTREYPPEVYGGAGVHVEYLARELARLRRRDRARLGRRPAAPGPASRRSSRTGPGTRSPGPSRYAAALRGALDRPGDGGRRRRRGPRPQPHLVREPRPATWRSLVHGIPHVATVHSLEPMRPWKAEQLGGGYALSSFAERTGLEGADAIIAVSAEMRRDLLRCLPGDRPGAGVGDPQRDRHRRVPARPGTDVLERHGIDPARPVGRVRRPDHAPEGPRAPARRGRAARPATRSSSSSPARRTRRRSPPRPPPTSSGCAATRGGVDLDRRDGCRAPT